MVLLAEILKETSNGREKLNLYSQPKILIDGRSPTTFYVLFHKQVFRIVCLFQEYLPNAPAEIEEKTELEDKEATTEQKLNFSYVECLLHTFHQLGKKVSDFWYNQQLPMF